MSSEIEAAGAAITAGLAASAIERKGGGPHEHGDCANCGAPVDGQFCAACGQPVHIHRTLGHMVEEFFHGIVHFDTKAWRTLPMLAFRPGTLTHGYIHGKRARFISPLAFFLFAVFMMFLVFALVGENEPGGHSTRAGLRATIAEFDADLSAADLDAAGREGLATGRQVFVDQLADLDRKAANLQAVRPIVAARLEEARAANDDADIVLYENTLKRIDEALGPEEEGLESLRVETNSSGGLDIDTTTFGAGRDAIFEALRDAAEEGTLIKTGNSYLDKKITTKLKNPEFLWYKIENTAYKFAFLLVPLGLPFLWLVFFWKKGVTLFDHTVFLLYSLTFVSMMFIVLMLLARMPVPGATTLAEVLPFTLPVHLFFQLKGGYALGIFSALWRTVALMFFSTICLFLFLLAILAMGLLG
jgi:hypothetical protein